MNYTRYPRKQTKRGSMTSGDDDNLSAIEVIRCVYLARLAGRRGHVEVARRWQAKADTWLAQQGGPDSGSTMPRVGEADETTFSGNMSPL